MAAAGLPVEDSKGECNLGQHEINFRFGPVVATADRHASTSSAPRRSPPRRGMRSPSWRSSTRREGSSCHIHLSLARDDGTALFADDDEAFDSFLAGQLATLRELTLFLAPNVNSYKRFAEGSFAPTTVAWGHDNRTCSMRVVGHGASKRMECRLPGADVNPYLALVGADRRRPARRGAAAPARARVRGQRLRLGQAARPA